VTDDGTPSDVELALRAQIGERHAFDLLVRRHRELLYRFVRRYIGNDDDAYDIVQDTFISAWMAMRRYDREKSFTTWLRAIALNKCRDFGRRQSVRRRFLRFAAPNEPDAPQDWQPDIRAAQDALEIKRLQRLDRAIAELPPFYKEPLLLTTTAGLSQQEAAAELRTTTKAIEMRIRRAKKKLAEALSDLKGES
jgi:RNA polymerase sigma-70 factor (ECF subfamily)